MRDLCAISRLRDRLNGVASLRIEHAAEVLGVSLRTLYRRRNEFEYLRRAGHIYVTTRSILEHIELQQYSPTAKFDLTRDADTDT